MSSRMSWKRVAAGAAAAAAALAMLNGGGGAAMAGGGLPLAQAAPGLSAVDPAQDGRDLFRGVFFLTGPQGTVVTEAMPLPDELVEANQSAEAAAAIDAIVTEADAIDPAFFTTFAGQLRSGDPFAVEQGLADGRTLMARAAEALGMAAVPGTVGGNTGQGAVVFAPLVAVAAIVVAVVSLAAAVNAGVAIEAFAAPFAAAASADGLGYEQTIAVLTEAFAS